MTAEETTEDALLGGRVRLRQPAKGYRAGLDAALLAAAAGAKAGERVIDIGCGPGGVLLQGAARSPGATWVGVERDPQSASLARMNLALNGIEDTTEIRIANVAHGFKALGLEPFDLALCNPPFFDDPERMRTPHSTRIGAYMADDGLEAWTGFLTNAVREGGRVVVIHRADRLADLLTLLGGKFGSFAVRPVHPFADTPAKRVLVRAVKTGRAPLRLLPPLVLHDRGAGHTAAAEAILRGDAELGW